MRTFTHRRTFGMAQLEWSCHLPTARKKETIEALLVVGRAPHVPWLTCHHQRYPSDYSYFPRTPVLSQVLIKRRCRHVTTPKQAKTY